MGDLAPPGCLPDPAARRRAWLLAILLATSLVAPSAAPHAHADPCVTPATRDLAARAYESPAQAYAGLTCLEAHFIARGDRRAIFTSLYATTTLRVAESIAAGAYIDPAWTSAYLVAFANLYREALWSYESGLHGRVPPAWRIAFDSARRGANLIVQDALLGVNAHVMRDLAHALTVVGIDPDRPTRHADHTAVDQVLVAIVDEMEQRLADLYSPALEDVDARLGDLDEILFGSSLMAGRAHAWAGAVRLTDAESGRAWALAAQAIAQDSVGVALLILSPRVSPELMARLHEAEGSDPLSAFCLAFPCARPRR